MSPDGAFLLLLLLLPPLLPPAKAWARELRAGREDPVSVHAEPAACNAFSSPDRFPEISVSVTKVEREFPAAGSGAAVVVLLFPNKVDHLT